METGTGQAPTESTASAQEATGSASAAGAASVGSQDEPKTFDAEYVRKLRDEAAGHRTKLRDAETELEKYRTAQLSEKEKLEKERDDAKTAAQEAQTRAQQRLVKAEVLAAVAKAGIVDADAAFRLLDQGAVKYDDAGDPTNVAALVEQLAKDKPYLVGAAGGGGTSAANAAGGRGAVLTIEQIKGMSREQIMARWDDVQKAMKAAR